jgi:uncharacterized membrane protein YoaK (UPF0700 family)
MHYRVFVQMAAAAAPAPANLSEHPLFAQIVAFACVTALQSGFLNGVFLISGGTFVSSVNGLLSLVARDYVSALNFVRGSLLLGQIGTFLVGCVLAGLLYDEPLRNERRYLVGVAAISLMIFLLTGIFAIGSDSAKTASLFLAAFTFGFQNAMGSYYSKGVLRTTHQTGAVTDLGLLLGQWLQMKIRRNGQLPKRPEFWKVKALLPLLLAYFGGGFCGVAAYVYGSYVWMVFPGGVTLAACVGIYVWLTVDGRRRERELQCAKKLLVSIGDQFEETLTIVN